MNEKTISSDFENFLSENRQKINQSFNNALWVFIAAGPLIAIAVYFDIFAGVTYLTAFLISIFMLTLAVIHKVLMKHTGKISSIITCMVALLAIDILLFMMDSAHLTIYVSWFLVPLLCLQFCDFKLYFIAVAVNYCFMVLATWHMAPYFTERRTDFDTTVSYLFSRLGGLTVEMLVMIFAGYALCGTIIRYYRNLLEKAAHVSRDQMLLKQKSSELEALAGDYIWVEDIDIRENTLDLIFTSDEKVAEYIGDTRNNAKQLLPGYFSLMSKKECMEDILKFVDFNTLDERIGDGRSISCDYQDYADNRRRARFIVSERSNDGRPARVIWVVEDIDE